MRRVRIGIAVMCAIAAVMVGAYVGLAVRSSRAHAAPMALPPCPPLPKRPPKNPLVPITIGDQDFYSGIFPRGHAFIVIKCR